MTDGEGPDGACAGLGEAFDLGAVLGADFVDVAALADGVDMGSDLSLRQLRNKKAALRRGVCDGIPSTTIRHRSRVSGRSIRRRKAIG
jgi:hypothetical protein